MASIKCFSICESIYVHSVHMSGQIDGKTFGIYSVNMIFHILLIFNFWICVSDASYPTPEPTSHGCTSLIVKEYISDIEIKKYHITSVDIGHDSFYPDGYTLQFKPKDKSSKCWYHYVTNNNKMVFIPNKPVLAIDQPFIVNGKSGCSSASSNFNVHVTKATDQIYCLKFETLVQSNLDVSCEASHVFSFMKKLSKYLNINLEDLRVFDYNKIEGKDNLLKLSWTFSDQILDCQTCNLEFIQKQFLQKLVYQHGEINENFQNYMTRLEPSFILHYIQHSSSCNDVTTTQITPSAMTTTSNVVTSTRDTTLSGCIQPYIVNPITTLEVKALKYTNIQIPKNTFNDENLILTVTMIEPANICLFRVFGYMIHFLPLLNVFNQQPVDGYKFKMVATNTCGQSVDFNFYVKVSPIQWSDCITVTLNVKHNLQSCDISKRGLILDRLRQLTNYKFEFLLLDWLDLGDVTRIKLTLTRDTFNCAQCNENTITNLKQYFIQANDEIKVSFRDILKPLLGVESITFVFTETCQKCRLERFRSLHVLPGEYKQIELSIPIKSLVLKSHVDQCWAYLPTKRSIGFLPMFSFGNTNKRFEIVIEGCSVPQTIEIFFTKKPHYSCYSFSVSFIPKADYNCLAEPVEKMRNLLAKQLHLKTEDILVVSYNYSTCKHGTQNRKGVEAKFTFSKKVLPHSLCSYAAVKYLMSNIINFDGNIHHAFVNTVNAYFIIHSVSGLLRITSHEDHFSHYTTSYVPLWIYMLPVFIMLFLLILLLLVCCCSHSFYRCFISCCCAVCYRVHPVKHRKMASTKREHKHKDKTLSYSTGGFHNAAYKDEDFGLERADNRKSLSGKSSYKNGVSFQSDDHSSSVKKNSSIRVRSYSDSDLLEGSALKLPQTPSFVDGSSERRQTSSERRQTSSEMKQHLVSTNSSGALPIPKRGNTRLMLKYPMTLPIKLTARVKNIKTTPIDLSSFRPRRIEVTRKATEASLPTMQLHSLSPTSRSLSMDNLDIRSTKHSANSMGNLDDFNWRRKYGMSYGSSLPRRYSLHQNASFHRHSRKGSSKVTGYLSDSEV